jgi:hypothetical protein
MHFKHAKVTPMFRARIMVLRIGTGVAVMASTLVSLMEKTVWWLTQHVVLRRMHDALGILESIHRHIESGLQPMEAVFAAQRESADDPWRVRGTRSNILFRGDVL